jgi:hypothetical protein
LEKLHREVDQHDEIRAHYDRTRRLSPRHAERVIQERLDTSQSRSHQTPPYCPDLGLITWIEDGQMSDGYKRLKQYKRRDYYVPKSQDFTY